jgi:RNA polymerase sigma-70 factor (ECF subfamily)
MPSGSAEGVNLLFAGVASSGVNEPFAPEGSEDAILITAARDGDRAAFGYLYQRYARMVHGVLLAKVPTDDVDDLVHDVFVQALRRLSTLRETGSFGAWLAAIARNLANDYYRRSVPQEELKEDVADQQTEGKTVQADEKRLATAVLEAIRSLPDSYREPLILRLVEGMTGPEIAARTGLTHGSVRVNLHRGMQQLRAKLNLVSRGSEQESQHS